LEDPELESEIGTLRLNNLKEELELIEGVYPPFDQQEYLEGNLQPVLFGSALNNFGVQELLNCFIEIAPKPLAKESDMRLVEPEDKKFAGFVFKIHANMDPNHRDRLAFIKIVSGTFERNKPYHHVRLNKKLKFSSPQCLFCREKTNSRHFLSRRYSRFTRHWKF
jgi:peptide chain release factor 3